MFHTQFQKGRASSQKSSAQTSAQKRAQCESCVDLKQRLLQSEKEVILLRLEVTKLQEKLDSL